MSRRAIEVGEGRTHRRSQHPQMVSRLEHVIARNMAEMRLERGWTQADLARRVSAFGLRWTPNRVTQLETLRRPVSLFEITALAWTFAVPLPRLLGGDDLVKLPAGGTVPLSRFRAAFAGQEAD